MHIIRKNRVLAIVAIIIAAFLLVPASFAKAEKNSSSTKIEQPDKKKNIKQRSPAATVLLVYKNFKIKESLAKSASQNNIPKRMLSEAVNILETRAIRDFKKGDELELLYRSIKDKKGSKYELEYVRAKKKEKDISLYRFKNKDGKVKFYDRLGRTDPKPYFIRPVNGGRISSGWGWRTHPVLGGKRFHKGIDFALPEGSKVFATADGVVEYMGWRNNYGYYIRIRHNSTYKTAYAHLNDFADNIDQGTKVKQGQVIAYVGETGLATGPHLYYEMIKSGFHINPLTVKEVRYETIGSKEKARLSKLITVINNEIKSQKASSKGKIKG